jgi:aspartate-semialdehyde dehydrogenase
MSALRTDGPSTSGAGARVAILGATGAVGTELLRLLDERGFPLDGDPVLLASARSAGRKVPWRGRELEVREVTTAAFDGIDIALFSAGGSRSKEWAPVAAAAGAVVVDNSSAWRGDVDVPLVVAEVNPDAMTRRPKGIVANPNCTTMALMVPAKPLHDAFGLVAMVATSYQAAGGAGQSGIDELLLTHDKLAGRVDELRHDGAAAEASVVTSVFPRPIAWNVVPHCGSYRDDRYTDEERKLVDESRKILAITDLVVSPTCVRVPVLVGHAIAARMTFARPVTHAEVVEALQGAPGMVLADAIGPAGEPLELPTPLASAGRDEVLVGRIREDYGDPCSINLFVAGDNLLKGAALNAVQIAELLVR